ncbi:hypothetical protein [Wolbachia endosymbiont of Aedes albopictus]|nr:hypothetical protein [Wolbachia endosymbiont of Aedes albopictus]UVW83758.1 hypothetical protein NHG98_05375 [Wolbachia endosymbiont of Aedes albopictus]
MTVRGGMTVKQFVIPQRDLLLAPRRYDGSRWHDDNFVIPLLVSGISC